PVYNLEVQDEHVYYVGTNGVLAHNAGDNYQKGSKPKYSPDLDKWIDKKGGTAWSELEGTWVYKDADGNIVRYPDGYPDFEGAGLVRQSTVIVQVPNRTTDFTDADASAPLGPRLPTNTWHHHQNMTTMQEFDSIIHWCFTHEGGYSRKKRGRE
ncbi:MAG: HNH endonuclease, partial [Planctomycetaceae bacterium]|nr:HNH endonuclease [Planctomycetaceae bacterium]